MTALRQLCGVVVFMAGFFLLLALVVVVIFVLPNLPTVRLLLGQAGLIALGVALILGLLLLAGGLKLADVLEDGAP